MTAYLALMLINFQGLSVEVKTLEQCNEVVAYYKSVSEDFAGKCMEVDK